MMAPRASPRRSKRRASPESARSPCICTTARSTSSHSTGPSSIAPCINVNYRYLDDELAYLLDNSDAQVLVFHTSLSACVARVRERLPNVRLFVEVDDGGRRSTAPRASTISSAATSPKHGSSVRSDDLYMLYTGEQYV